MPYRPNGRSWQGSTNPLRNPKRASYASRLAAARAAKRKPKRGGPAAIIALGLVLIVTVVTVASATIIAAGGAIGMTIATLEQGLPDVRAFRDLGFAEPTTMLDRSGSVELAQFWEERREVVRYGEIPPLILDVTTVVEDDTFWENPGFDLEATVNAFAQELGGGDRGGASTITQQLVRSRLLPTEVIDADDTADGLYTRKALEIIQAFKLTQAYPGEEGKKSIITAYLNEIFYGAGAYGIAAAADLYFGKDLDDLSIAEAALLAGLPQRPNEWNPYHYAVNQKIRRKGRKGRPGTRLVVPTDPGRWENPRGKPTVFGARNATWRVCKGTDSEGCAPPPPVVRRAFTLRRLHEGKGRWTTLSDEQLEAALQERIVLKPRSAVKYKAPHFVVAAAKELEAILGDREPIRRGGYTVTTTLDMKAQKIGERFVKAGATLPSLSGAPFHQQLRTLGLVAHRRWIGRLRGSNIRNGAMAAIDYRTGDILAYVGSADYYRKQSVDGRFDPRYDHVGQGRRQPGSAWKPIIYATAFDTGALTPGSVILDITTPFRQGWTPKDADGLDRGPMLVRKALQYSLNIPAIRALHRTGVKTVRRYANKAGLSFIRGPRHLDEAGLAGGIGTVEVRLIDLVAAYGAFGNGGKVTRPRHILKVEDSDGRVIYRAGQPATKQVWSPQAAYLMADILAGNTDPRENLVWGKRFPLRNGPGRSYRVAALKTGTTNDLRDYSTYGLVPMPRSRKEPAVAAGFWFGNSDHSSPRLSPPVYSMDNAGQAWHGFMREYLRGKPTATFRRPDGIVTATIDRFTGGLPGPWTLGTVQEIFIEGTQPGGRREVDPPGLLYCGGVVMPLNAENRGAPASWIAAVNSWAARNIGSRGVDGAVKSTFSLAGITSFGGPTAPGTCGGGAVRVAPDGDASQDGATNEDEGGPTAGDEGIGGRGVDGRGRRGGGGNRDGNGSGGPAPIPTCRPGSTTKPSGCVVPAPG